MMPFTDEQLHNLLEVARFACLPDAEKLGFLATYARRFTPELAITLLEGYIHMRSKQG